MRRRLILILLAQAVLVAAVALVVKYRWVPLGVRGQWEWGELPARYRPYWSDVLGALIGLAAYAGFVAVGFRSLSKPASRLRERLWVLALYPGAAVAQLAMAWGAPEGFGLAKWAFQLHDPAASGYYTVARYEIHDGWQFLDQFPRFVQQPRVPREGAHPPGLFLATHAARRLMASYPALATFVEEMAPVTIRAALKAIAIYDPMPRSDRTALILIGAITWLACMATVWPLYALARSALEPRWAWVAAALWPWVPSAILFQPTADAAYPLLATAALALVVVPSRWRLAGALVAGMLLGLGMFFSLAFLPIGLTVGFTQAATPGASWGRRLRLILATGAGFLAVVLSFWLITGVNPFLIWWWNRLNHARFYQEFHRSYGRWVVVDIVELAVAVGIPVFCWAVLGLSRTRTPRFLWAVLAVLALLNFGGLTLSEVARLWLPWMPALLIAAAQGMERAGAGPRSLAITAALLGSQTLALQSFLQLVYTIS